MLVALKALIARARSRGAVPACREAQALDLSDAAVAQDPFRHYETLRRLGAVHFLPRHGFWLVLSYDDVFTVLTTPETFSSRPMQEVDPALLGADGAAHAEMRRRLGRCFSGDALQAITRRLETRAVALLSALVGEPRFDMVRDVAAPLAEFVAGCLLGLDDGTIEAVRAGTGDAERETLALFEPVGAALAALVDRVPLYRELVRPGDGACDAATARSVTRLLWIAGTSTTKRVVTSSTRLLLEHPELRARIAAEPELLGAFLEESFRLHPPEHLIGRMTTTSVELGGQRIHAGEIVQVCLSAANRDPAKFVDPDRLEPHRPPPAHLAFGAGGHRCPGAALARLQATVVLRALLTVMPRFRAAEPLSSLRYVVSAHTHALERLRLSSGQERG